MSMIHCAYRYSANKHSKYPYYDDSCCYLTCLLPRFAPLNRTDLASFIFN